MSHIDLPNSAGFVDTFTRVEGADTVHMQAVVPVDPVTGDPLLLAQQATLAAVQELNDTMVTLLSAMLKKMPRLTTGERLAAALVTPADYDPSSAYHLLNVSTVVDGAGARLVYRMFEPWNFSDTGAARLYAQILVS
ncbi:hypothetical protein [Accumulibacter sp.]|uniref:hypothetical protein n=1 Tax=Accumulibacter sp. TaxID=2053492 RepID=UPI0025D986C8|nr:hypothetical protein [Accumulibacter sp.]MCM8595178.1 hypothetical protein [Accumulibacter sp.]MCM8625982.1 hypothetical protein [Accumulibacter sp.]MDS4049324.1 hypothetical protein [Accumulibacter sp.]